MILHVNLRLREKVLIVVTSEKQPEDSVSVPQAMDSPVKRPILDLEDRNTDAENGAQSFGTELITPCAILSQPLKVSRPDGRVRERTRNKRHELSRVVSHVLHRVLSNETTAPVFPPHRLEERPKHTVAIALDPPCLEAGRSGILHLSDIFSVNIAESV